MGKQANFFLAFLFSAIFLPFSFGKDGFSLFLKKLLDKSCAVWYPIVSRQ